MNSWINLHALWKIVVLGIAAGAGLPAIFAIGLRVLSTGPNSGHNGAVATAGATTATDDDGVMYGGNPVGLVLASLCFAVVLAAIGWGIYSIVSAS